MKVQFVPQGLEDERILFGIQDGKAEKVIIVRNSNDKIIPETEYTVCKLVEEVMKKIDEGKENRFSRVKNVEHDTVKVDFFDFANAFGGIFEATIREIELGHTVSFNIASGTKVVSTAMYLIGMITGSEVLYVIPKEYLPDNKDGKRTKGVIGVYEFPPLKIDLGEYNVDAMTILSELNENGGHVEKQTHLKRSASKLSSSKMSRIINELDRMGYLNCKMHGREKEVTLTESGRKMFLMGLPIITWKKRDRPAQRVHR